jgi:predicted 2-oxoglutarate/Fe(II)-dependent dioxygenase YbiX
MFAPEPTLIPDFLDPATCHEVRAAMDRGTGEPAEVLSGGIGLDEFARRATSIDVDTRTLRAVEERLDATRDLLSARCGTALGGREGTGFLRYAEGGFYGPHRDQGHHAEWPPASERRISVVVFLNSAEDDRQAGEFVGGELVIYRGVPPVEEGDPIRITPRAGLLVAFDAARLHEVRPVTKGVRDVIVDWFY